MTFILQGNDSVSEPGDLGDWMFRAKGENPSLLVNLVLQTRLEILVKTNDHKIARCP